MSRGKVRTPLEQIDVIESLNGNTMGDLNNNELRNMIHNHNQWAMLYRRVYPARFEWHGMPDTVDIRFLEYTLMMYGKAVFFMQGDKLRVAQVTLTGPEDMYGYQHVMMAIGAGGFTYNIPDGEGIVIWETMNRDPYLYTAQNHISKLADIDSRADANRAQQQEVGILIGPEEKANDLKVLANALQLNKSMVVGDKSLPEDIGMTYISTGVQYKYNDFATDSNNHLMRFYRDLGINYLPIDKRSQVISSEVNSVDDIIAKNRRSFLVPRMDAARELNEKFGLDVWVEWSTDKPTTYTSDEVEDVTD